MVVTLSGGHAGGAGPLRRVPYAVGGSTCAGAFKSLWSSPRSNVTNRRQWLSEARRSGGSDLGGSASGSQDSLLRSYRLLSEATRPSNHGRPPSVSQYNRTAPNARYNSQSFPPFGERIYYKESTYISLNCNDNKPETAAVEKRHDSNEKFKSATHTEVLKKQNERECRKVINKSNVYNVQNSQPVKRSTDVVEPNSARKRIYDYVIGDDAAVINELCTYFEDLLDTTLSENFGKKKDNPKAIRESGHENSSAEVVINSTDMDSASPDFGLNPYDSKNTVVLADSGPSEQEKRSGKRISYKTVKSRYLEPKKILSCEYDNLVKATTSKQSSTFRTLDRKSTLKSFESSKQSEIEINALPAEIEYQLDFPPRRRRIRRRFKRGRRMSGKKEVAISKLSKRGSSPQKVEVITKPISTHKRRVLRLLKRQLAMKETGRSQFFMTLKNISNWKKQALKENHLASIAEEKKRKKRVRLVETDV